MSRQRSVTVAFRSAGFGRSSRSATTRTALHPPRLLLVMLFAVCMLVPQELFAALPYGRVWSLTWDLGWINDRGQSVATDSAGDVYVVGFDQVAYYLRKYSPTGSLVWSKTAVTTEGLSQSGFINGHVVVDPSGNPILAGSIDTKDERLIDYFVVKFDPNGEQLWMRRFDVDNGEDSLSAVAVDADGNIYAHGHGDSETASTIHTVKYAADGTQLWVATYNSADDLACDVAVHSDGSVYVLASTTGFSTDDDIILIKYNASGEQLWLRRYNGGGEGVWTDDWPSRLRLDSAGNAYLVGYSTPAFKAAHGVVTQKYLADGTLAWTRRYDVAGSTFGDLGHEPAGLAIDASGQVYVSGRVANASEGTYGGDLVTLKYTADGEQLWSRTYNGTGNGADAPRDLVLASDGSILLLARTCIGPYSDEFRVVLFQYDSDGALLSSSLDTESHEGYMLARRGASVYAVGTGVYATSTGYDMTIRKYSAFPSVSINDVAVTEGQGGTKNAVFTVLLSEASDNAVTVDYQTANGTALAHVAGEITLANSASISMLSSGAATPYPSSIMVPSGLGGLQKVTATLTGFSHTWPSHVDVLLRGPAGQSVILMSDVGSSIDATNLTFVFDDAGPALGTGTLASGTYRPTNISSYPEDSWPSPAPAGPYGTALSAFNGTDPAGLWTLWVVDVAPGQSGSISGGWSLTLTTPAEAGDYAITAGTLGIPAGATSRTVTVAISGETAVEADETFFVNLSNASNATIGDSQGIGTIVNDDGGLPIRGDFTSDAKSDVLWRHGAQGDVWLWPMDGAARATETYVRTVADMDWEIRGAGDQTGDGKADILWRNKVTGMIYFWPMDGSTPLAETYVATVDPAYDIVGTGDFDGDGKSDILWRHTTLGDVWIWLMDGATPKPGGQVYIDRVVPAYVVKGVGDLDGDGKADIVWHGAAGDVWVWMMNGTTRLSQTWVGTVPDTHYQIQQVADFDGNGKADLLWWNTVQGDVWIWPMNGATVLSENYVGVVPDTNYRIQAAGDYDGDGKADILWRHTTQGDVWVWLMNGTTCLSETWVATVPDVGYEIVKVK